MAEGAARRTFVPETVQSSAMDCGPAVLKSLLEGHGIRASYGRLREACQTAVDGTSIDTLEALAGMLGLEVEQIMVPVEHLFLAETGALPAVLVVTLPSGLTHFVVVWSVRGGWAQVMDPARGRRWVRTRELARDAYLHEAEVEEPAFDEWVRSDGFLEPLAVRLRAAAGATAMALLDDAKAQPGWRALAALDAAVRVAEALAREHRLRGGRAATAVRAFYAAALEDPDAFGPGVWTGRSAGDGTVRMRGAVLLRVLGVAPGPADAPPEVRAVLEAPPDRPGAQLVQLLRADGLWRWWPVALGLAAAALGAVGEAVLFRGLFDVGRRLAVVEQRLVAGAALLVVVGGILCLEWPVMRALAGMGRRLELRLRRAFLAKLPRLGDRYFQSRPVSDMAERAHLVHWLRALPGAGGQVLRAACELAITAAGIVWLHPPSAPLVLALAAAMVVIPFCFQPALIERDLRMRSHAGGLVRFYLDALLGLTAIRAHTAEPAIRTEHGERLREWARAARASAGVAVTAEATQAAAGFALAAWILFDHLRAAPGSGWALLLVYWVLTLPALGQELSYFVQQYPEQRNVTLRLLEPLGAPETESVAGPSRDASGGVEIALDRVVVEIAGRAVLTVPSLHVRAGEHVAVVGVSGTGKSTLAGLLLGWHLPASGQVLVDGAPLAGEALAALRRETVWVDPAVHLWNRSLLDNLRYGGPSTSVGAAVEDAELDDVLSRLPAGMETAMGEGGGLLSGGEGQRVRLGRAFHRGAARLVVLDEAFRGLERARRRALLARARQRWAGATLVCVTHDVGDTTGFDRVMVVAEGQIAEDGAPGTLAARTNSRYAALLGAELRVRERLRAGWRRLRVGDGVVRDGDEADG